MNACFSRSMGYESEPYYDLIYPKITEAIVLMILAAQNHMERRRCRFELYDADFMLVKDTSDWLIEINIILRMHLTSFRLTRRLYSNVLESLMKGEQQNGYKKIIIMFERKFFRDGDERDVD